MPLIRELEAIRRNQILTAAIKILGIKGYVNITMADIAKEAGLSKGGLSHYYSSKDDLLKEAYRAYFERIINLFKEKIDKSPDFVEKVLGFELHLFIQETADVSFAHKIVYDFMSLAAHDPEYQNLFSKWINIWVNLKKQVIDDWISSDLFIPHDSVFTARTISAIFHGIYMRWYLDPKNHTTDWAEKSFTKAIKAFLRPYMVNNIGPNSSRIHTLQNTENSQAEL